jgi:hypothetical protein
MFMMIATSIIQGTIEVSASAKRQERMYARVKPVQNAEKKLTARGTFSEMPS